MYEFLQVLAISGVAAFLTYLGAPVAEKFEVSFRFISAALHFAAGIITALVAFTLMPPALREGPFEIGILAFFFGGVAFVAVELISARVLASTLGDKGNTASLGLYIGILVDLVIDGALIGVGSTISFNAGLLLALGLALSTAPLAFITTAAAKRQGVSPKNRRLISYLFVVCILAGSVLGFGLLRHQPEPVRLTLLAFAGGFLLTMVAQNMIPAANREGEPNFAGILFVGGISLYALMNFMF